MDKWTEGISQNLYFETFNISGCFDSFNRNNILNHLEVLKRNLYLYSAKYEDFLILQDFNTEIKNSSIKSLYNCYY